ncbi:glycoside hydrolase family 3 protein [Reinekea sp. G2M2-21]|uniref:glycoside hydrolase family 3 protein n=1 Tax=Reinekea sp. G2M2-21 TaxID=2788942 RepID=UPI0018AC7735|nr:glycoside hydrolase family 3 protein [Reinekea sp. G2M2-21]
MSDQQQKTERYHPDLHSTWVSSTLAAMSLPQKVGQLLHPFLMPFLGVDQALASLHDIEVGGAFFFPERKEILQQLSDKLQARLTVPAIVASDLENGAGRMVNGAVVFPDNMAVAATGDAHHAYVMGEAAAKEGLDVGVHWSFGPVVDINANIHNPITNTRSFGDKPSTIKAFATQMIHGMQQNGLVACAKHFPGDGFDDRDQHLCTTINPLSFDDWQASSGQLFQDMIDAGVWSIMIGHIALPCVDPGETGRLADAPSAVMSKKITTDLLRKKMGFDGVIISDAIGMGGSCTQYPESEIVVRSIESGCDMVLFCQPKPAFQAIINAVETGRLSEARIDESVRRLLALKETLGIHQNVQRPAVSADDQQRFAQTASQVAEQALTEVVNTHAADAFPLTTGMKVLCMHLRGDPQYHVDGIDDQLRARGIDVVRWSESDEFHMPDWHDLSGYDAIIIATVYGPTWATGRIRLAGNYSRALVEAMKSHHSRLVMASFGSPYHVYEYPKVPCYVNCYSPDEHSQTAFVKYLFGELKPTGRSPVDLNYERMFAGTAFGWMV